MRKRLFSILLCLAAIPTLLTGCGGNGDGGETEPETHVQKLSLEDTWTVDGQWEMTIRRVRYLGAGGDRILVFYDYKNLGCENGTEGYGVLRLVPHVYATAKRESEFRPDELDIRTAAVGKSAKKCSYFVASADGSTIQECWVVFSQTADGGDTYEAVYHVLLGEGG